MHQPALSRSPSAVVTLTYRATAQPARSCCYFWTLPTAPLPLQRSATASYVTSSHVESRPWSRHMSQSSAQSRPWSRPQKTTRAFSYMYVCKIVRNHIYYHQSLDQTSIMHQPTATRNSRATHVTQHSVRSALAACGPSMAHMGIAHGGTSWLLVGLTIEGSLGHSH